MGLLDMSITIPSPVNEPLSSIGIMTDIQVFSCAFEEGSKDLMLVWIFDRSSIESEGPYASLGMVYHFPSSL